jgi:dTDP-4-dehydrorhamnose reductase
MLNILVTGAAGQLGSEIKRIASRSNHYNYTFVDVEEMDLASDEAIARFFQGRDFDFIINCAAYTAVDRAEEDSGLAYRINAASVKTLTSICRERKIRLIHISTDYVFDGAGNKPINEEAAENPLSVYGKSKLEGEKHVLSTLPDAYVIRTAWVYSSFGKNFVKTISRLASERQTISVVSDQIGSPTYARDLAQAIIDIIKAIETKRADNPGVYHYSNEGSISWYDLACFIVKHYDFRCEVKPIPTEEYKTLAIRPTFSVLDKRKIKRTFGLEIPHWHQSLVECLKELSI